MPATTGPLDVGLAGQWALVTGASKGIGFGIAARLVGAGANVVLVARSAGDLDAAADGLRAGATGDQRVVVRSSDTSDPGAIAELFAWADADVPPIDLLVANAGSGGVVPFLELTAEDWQQVIDLNLTGTFHCVQQAARRMVQRPEGTNRAVVVVSSIRALGIRPGLAHYAASKAGANQLVRMAAHELAPHGIRVNVLSPGITVTPLVERTIEERPEIFEERLAGIPAGRAGTPDDMGRAAVYLCSPASAFVTGTNLVVDGGESLW